MGEDSDGDDRDGDHRVGAREGRGNFTREAPTMMQMQMKKGRKDSSAMVMSMVASDAAEPHGLPAPGARRAMMRGGPSVEAYEESESIPQPRPAPKQQQHQQP